MLTASRYVDILKDLHAGEIDETKRRLDWWIDLAIMEMAMLEEDYPQLQWGEVTVDKEADLKMKSMYRRIAQFRKSHPRRHIVPLEPSELKLIDAFVQKHQ